MKAHAVWLGCLVSGLLLTGAPEARSSPVWTSAVTLGGSERDLGQTVKIDREGNRYVTGSFSATGSFPVRAAADTDDQRHSYGAPKMLVSAGGMDIFLAKYDHNGKLQWVLPAGGSEDDEGFDIGFDSAGNVYLTGVFTDNATFRGTNGAEKTVSGTGETIFLAKYHPSGVLSWVQTGTTEFDSSNNGYGVAVEPVSGSIYITGVSQGPTTFSSSNGSTHVVDGVDTWHMYIVRYDTAGNFHWGQTNAASPNTVAHKIAVDEHNNVYATGWMEGTATFYSNDGHDVTVDGFSQPVQSFPDYPCDAFIVKYDRNGNLKWVNHIGGYKGIGADITTASDGNVSVTGIIGNIGDSPQQAETIVTSQPGGKDVNLGSGTLTAPFNRDVFVATFNTNGVLLEARRFGGPEDDGGSGIAYDHDGSLVLAGVFGSVMSIDGATLTGKDSTNLFVAKFAHHGGKPSGTPAARLSWLKEADGPGIEGFENDPRIALTSSGGVVVTGTYEPAARFGHFSLTGPGDEDVFLALLSEDDDDH